MDNPKNERFTPPVYIEAARSVMGEIYLDPASTALANRKIVKATHFFDKSKNGLIHEWPGRVWLNPPLSGWNYTVNKRQVEAWVEKARLEYSRGNMIQGIMLVNASTCAKWFQPIWNYTLCFTDHRICFLHPETLEPMTRPRYCSVFVYLGTLQARFASVFEKFGHIAFPR